MCGINGIVSADIEIRKKIAGMNKLLRHRGPDDEGFFLYNSKNRSQMSFCGEDSIGPLKEKLVRIENADFSLFDTVLGHRRLSIIDLSEKGHGPMCDTNKQVWITYNGEVYNYIELRAELENAGYKFYSNTDTEVILNSYLHWGTECLNRFNGMWAFAILDTRDNSIFLARDRFGIKPLYYCIDENYFAFSSEIKPLLLLNPNSYEINDKKIPFFILYGNRLNSEDTYIKKIYSLKPSNYLIFKNDKLSKYRYYDIPVKEQPEEKELQNQLLDLLTDSVRLRFRSDVPVGTCLSGGFDSSSIVSISRSFLDGSLNTFSAVWSDKECDESRYIDIVNNKFNCTENKIEPTSDEFLDVLKQITYYQEIPTEGPGLYPQWFVMKKAQNKVKVLLDGQGGDEVFGGYFLMGAYLRSLISDKNYSKILIESKNYFSFLNKQGIHSFSSWLFPSFYNFVVRGHLSKRHLVLNNELINSFSKNELYPDYNPPKKYHNYLNNLSYHFIYAMTIPTLLHYEDRASMAHSIESRVPYLDYRLVELGLNLKPKFLVNKNISRPLFRKSLSGSLPAEIIKRTDKLGYPTPFNKWSRTCLNKPINETLMNPGSLIKEYLNIDLLKKRLTEHQEGKIDYSWDLWRILSLENFLRLYKNKEFIKTFK